MAIITLANLKVFLGITGEDQDALLTMYLDAINEFVGQYCKRTFEDTTYTDLILDGPGSNCLVVPNYPIISVTEIFQNEDEVDQRDEDDVTDNGWFITNYDWGLIYNTDPWDRGRGVIRITYRAGYSDVAMPAGLKLACYKIGAYMFNTGRKTGIRAESLGSYSYSLATDAGGLSTAIPDILANMFLSRYRRREFGIVYG